MPDICGLAFQKASHGAITREYIPEPPQAMHFPLPLHVLHLPSSLVYPTPRQILHFPDP
ncbi:MAG: hypothetical protein FWG89_05180 [Treponema sp.]|nr:hypothetical protein [Treponema sp.]